MKYREVGRANGMRNPEKGFTLIEIMVAIAIVAILTTLAVSSYSNFVVRAKTAECVAGAIAPQLSIGEYRNKTGNWPPAGAVVGFAADFTSFASQSCTGSKYFDGTGKFQMYVDSSAVGIAASTHIYPQFNPAVTATGTVRWQCSKGNTTADAIKYLPPECREENP